MTESYNAYLREEEKNTKFVDARVLSRYLGYKGFKKDKIRIEGTPTRIIRGLKLKDAFEAIEDENNNVIDFKK